MTTAPTSRTGSSRGAATVRTVLLGLGVAAMAAALALGALAVRAALATGACIEGGAAGSSLPCPTGLIPSIPLVVGLGVVGAVLALVSARRLATPNPLLVAWTALFLILAWLFLDDGLLHPGEQGVRIGFIVIAAVFVLLAAAPLFPSTRGAATGTSGALGWWLYYLLAAAVGVLAGLELWHLLST